MYSDPEFDELKREFLAEAQHKAQDIRQALQESTPQALERMGYLAHQLKGAGGSYGFQNISSEAADIERAVEEASPGPDLLTSVGKSVERLNTEIESRLAELRIGN